MIAFARNVLRKLDLDIVRLRHSNSELPQHLANVIAHHNIDCVIDVGANVGQYAKEIRALGFTGHIVSFEPVAAVFEQLSAAADKDPKWHCMQMALGEKSETKQINVYSSSVFSSFREANEYSKNI